MDPRLSPMETPAQTAQQNKRSLIFNLLLLLAVFIAVTFIMPTDARDDLFIWNEKDLLITFPDDSTCSVPFDAITDIAFLANTDPGTCLSGGSDGVYLYGTWRNDRLDSYTLCSFRCDTHFIQFTTDSGIYWISYESPETTQSLYQSVVETLRSEGYAFTSHP